MSITWPGRTPEADLDEAETLIDACGYHRPDRDLADARARRTLAIRYISRCEV
ncbi:MAG: hypothetical protein ACREU9_08130 [Gammaproteobacteria bacterium]